MRGARTLVDARHGKRVTTIVRDPADGDARSTCHVARHVAYAFNCHRHGGLSIPKIGASRSATASTSNSACRWSPQNRRWCAAAPPEWLAQFGALSGTSFNTIASISEQPGSGHFPAFRESALITHRGLSGPAILQVSSYWQLAGGRGAVMLDLMPERDAGAWLAAHRHDTRSLGALLEEFLPRRFAQSFAQAHGWTLPLAQLSNATVKAIAHTLKGWRMQPSAHSAMLSE